MEMRSGEVVVETRAGAVRGRWRPGSAAFLGIPYAEPPFGDRRFLAPEPRAPWSGVRDALEHAATPQRRALAEVTTIPEPSIPGEDILTVDVFTPDPSPGAGLPVLVYLHGGGYVAGSPASPWYDGRSFNRDGVVTVTVSYRLGFEGFGWLPDAPANRGVLDWLLALGWVRDSIDAFGGDPARVTVAGQSAGGGAVMTLLTNPRARGLFAAAASLSGVPADVPLEEARRTTTELASRLGVRADRAGFASVPEESLIEAQGWRETDLEEPTTDDLLALMRSLEGVLRLGPVIDGEVVPWTVEDGLRAGAGGDVPLLAGATREEWSGLAVENRHLFEESDVASLLERLGLEPSAAERYAAALPGHHQAEVVGQYLSDRMFRRRVVDWLTLRTGAAPTWAYDFTWRSAVSGLAEHCLDVPFVFDLLDDPDVTRVAGPNPPQHLADLVHSSFVRFVTDHDPGWPAHDSAQAVMVLDAEPHVVTDGYESARALLTT
jgi:para-nitrobenzyl esterase